MDIRPFPLDSGSRRYIQFYFYRQFANISAHHNADKNPRRESHYNDKPVVLTKGNAMAANYKNMIDRTEKCRDMARYVNT